jgi:hypothetical protein
MTPHLRVLADALTCYGPITTQAPCDLGLHTNARAWALSVDVEVALLASLGSMPRAGWAQTQVPMALGVSVHWADYWVIGAGGMDHVPAAMPT